jgi:hypothetical protein
MTRRQEEPRVHTVGPSGSRVPFEDKSMCQPRDAHATGDGKSPRLLLPTIRTIPVHGREPAPWQAAVLAEPKRGARTQRAILTRLSGAPLEDCLSDVGVPGDVVLEFSWHFAARAGSVTMQFLGFRQIVDGPELSPETIRCFEAAFRSVSPQTIESTSRDELLSDVEDDVMIPLFLQGGGRD